MENPLIALFIVFIFLFIITFVDINKCGLRSLTKYERAMMNKSKINKKKLKKDIKMINRQINLMIEKGDTKSSYKYEASDEFFEYIREYNLFPDCKITINKYLHCFIEIEILNIQYKKENKNAKE